MYGGVVYTSHSSTMGSRFRLVFMVLIASIVNVFGHGLFGAWLVFLSRVPFWAPEKAPSFGELPKQSQADQGFVSGRL